MHPMQLVLIWILFASWGLLSRGLGLNATCTLFTTRSKRQEQNTRLSDNRVRLQSIDWTRRWPREKRYAGLRTTRHPQRLARRSPPATPPASSPHLASDSTVRNPFRQDVQQSLPEGAFNPIYEGPSRQASGSPHEGPSRQNFSISTEGHSHQLPSHEQNAAIIELATPAMKGESVLRRLAQHPEWINEHHADITRFQEYHRGLRRKYLDSVQNPELKRMWEEKERFIRTATAAERPEGKSFEQ